MKNRHSRIRTDCLQFVYIRLMEKVKPHSLYPERKGQVISLEKGKLPPQAVELEEVVLGAMMIDKKGVDEVIDILLR